MSFASFGIGVGAFAKGLSNGMALGREIKAARDANEISDIRQEGMQQAQEGREADIDANIQRTGLDGRDDFMGDVTTGYKVGDTTYSSPDEAREPASRGVDSVMDRFMRDTAPKVAEAYVGQGNVEKAEQWGEWLRDNRSRNAVGEWSKAYMAARNGDWESAASGFGKYYTDYIDDNVDYQGHEIMKDDQGNVTGFEINLLDNDDGQERTMQLSTQDLVDIGMANNPQMLFETELARTQAADEARLKQAGDIAAEDREFRRNVAMEGIKQGNRLDRDAFRSELDAQETSAEVDDTVRRLERAGYDENFINDMMPAILGIGEYQKQAPPEEVARMLHQKRLESSSPYGADSYAKMSPDEQREIIDADLEMFKQIGDNYSRRRRGSEQAGQRSPAADGLPSDLWLDTRTGY